MVPNLVALGAALFVWGAFYGSWDVAMDVHGSAVEQRAGQEWIAPATTPAGAWAASPGRLRRPGRQGRRPAGAALRRQSPSPAPSWSWWPCAASSRTGRRVRATPAGEPGASQPPDPLREAEKETSRTRDRAGRCPQPQGPRPRRSRVLTGRLLLVGVVTLCATTLEGRPTGWPVPDRRAGGDGVAGRLRLCRVRRGHGGGGGSRGRRSPSGWVATGPSGPTAWSTSSACCSPCSGRGWWSPPTCGAALWTLGVCTNFPAAVSASGELTGRPTPSPPSPPSNRGGTCSARP